MNKSSRIRYDYCWLILFHIVHCLTFLSPKLSQRNSSLRYYHKQQKFLKKFLQLKRHYLVLLLRKTLHYCAIYTITQPTQTTPYRGWHPSAVKAETSSQTSFKRPERRREELYCAMVYPDFAALLGRYLLKLLFRASISLLMLSSLANPENLLTAKQLLLHFSNWTFSSEFGNGGFSVYTAGR